MINPHGHREIFYLTISLLICGLAVGLFLAPYGFGWWGVMLLPVMVWVWGIWFFRDPHREAPDGEGLFLSPADGIVADITPLGPDGPLGVEAVQIGVFMNIFNVHVNRFPCDGVVRDISHKPGAFMDVRDPAAAERNESSTMLLIHEHDGQEHQLIVRQIAGLLARRIINFTRLGQARQRGERYGLIKFGSRVELILPKTLAGEICVELGQPVKAGLTVLARTGKAEA